MGKITMLQILIQILNIAFVPSMLFTVHFLAIKNLSSYMPVNMWIKVEEPGSINSWCVVASVSLYVFEEIEVGRGNLAKWHSCFLLVVWLCLMYIKKKIICLPHKIENKMLNGWEAENQWVLLLCFFTWFKKQVIAIRRGWTEEALQISLHVAVGGAFN